MRHHNIPGTVLFDGEQAQKGLALNRMCFSFNSAENREEFRRDEIAYCRKFGLTSEQHEAVLERDVRQAHRRRREYLLPGQACRNFRSWRAGYRRAADRCERRDVQGET